MTCSNADKNWPSNSKSNSVSHFSTYARSKPGFLRITEATSSRSRGLPATTFITIKSSSDTKRTSNAGKPHHLAAVDGLAFVFRQGKHEVDADVGLRVRDGKHESLVKELVDVIDEDPQLQLFDHAKHVGRSLSIQAQGYVDISRQPGLAVEQNCLPAENHVWQGRVIQGNGKSLKKFFEHGATWPPGGWSSRFRPGRPRP